MTFDDDFCQLEFDGGRKRVDCKQLGLQWPPPEKIQAMGFAMERVSKSEITDEERSELTCICRGALYRVSKEPTK